MPSNNSIATKAERIDFQNSFTGPSAMLAGPTTLLRKRS
jgi:hypothetical protein